MDNTIIIVDDDPDFLEILKEKLIRIGFTNVRTEVDSLKAASLFERGEVFDVAVDIRRGSPTFGQWSGTILSGKNKHQLFIPEGFAHGLCVISETADVVYKCTDLYAPGDEYGILWSDPVIGIDWPVENPILSEKDAESPRLMDVPEELLPKFT